MRRFVTFTAATVVLALGLGVTGSALASTTKTRHFTSTFLGASVSSNENVYDVRGSGLRGAAVQFVKANKAGTAGSGTLTAYDGQGSIVDQDSFTLSAPKNGIITITGSGHFVRGTGKYVQISGSYTFRGTENTKTGVIKVTATGTESY